MNKSYSLIKCTYLPIQAHYRIRFNTYYKIKHILTHLHSHTYIMQRRNKRLINHILYVHNTPHYTKPTQQGRTLCYVWSPPIYNVQRASVYIQPSTEEPSTKATIPMYLHIDFRETDIPCGVLSNRDGDVTGRRRSRHKPRYSAQPMRKIIIIEQHRGKFQFPANWKVAANARVTELAFVPCLQKKNQRETRMREPISSLNFPPPRPRHRRVTFPHLSHFPLVLLHVKSGQ